MGEVKSYLLKRGMDAVAWKRLDELMQRRVTADSLIMIYDLLGYSDGIINFHDLLGSLKNNLIKWHYNGSRTKN